VTSQGSAVAVSPKEAITNCHVVAHAKAILLTNAATTLKAEIVAADRSTDRCYLRVLDGELAPVPGIRDYASLAVGEVVFTIGSPKGFVNTLGQGLLSGLRTTEDNTEYIQITAPVSEGSSGGGLFDDRSNLIGVTTFTIKDSQSLNFAIAASQFWQ
jgi:S1-C subfamily serine protease